MSAMPAMHALNQTARPMALLVLMALAGFIATAQGQTPPEKIAKTAQAEKTAQTTPPQTQGLPDFAQVQADFRSSETWVLDRQGERIQRVRTDFSARRGDWVPLHDISPALLHAILLSEDKRFYEHSGVDWAAVGAAAWGNLWNERTRGASTISMQLAGLLNEQLRRRSTGRTWTQKWRQFWSTQDLEARWTKAQILEAYLNLAPFRGELVGVDALSRGLFDKAPHGLDQREAAVAAALMRAPTAPAQRVAERACRLLQQAQSPWGNDCKALHLYTEAAFSRRKPEAVSGDAPHFARYLLRQRKELAQENPQEIPSSLHAGLQRHAARALRQHVQALSGQNVQDGAVLVLDNTSGEILAWVGTSGLSEAPEVDTVLGLRQPGSTLKPFLYGQAIAQRRLTAATLLDDSPARIPTEFGIYAPENYDQNYKGWVSVRQALGSSLNIPAVRTLRMVSPDDFAELLRALGLHLPEPAGYYGYALALGGVDANLLQLTNAYRTLANGGLPSPVHAWPQNGINEINETDETRRVFDPAVAYIVGDILSDRHARVLTFGTDSALATRFWSAVKTGTSKDMRDNWTIGYTPHFTIGVWVGNADGSPMRNVSGISGAAPVWASVAAYANRLHPGLRPAPPENLVRTHVRYRLPEEIENGNGASTAREAFVEADRDEWFLPGTEQNLFVLHTIADGNAHHTGGADARIVEPTDGTVLALDPDIPPTNQMLRIASNQPNAHWWFNGERVEGLRAGERHWYWPPSPGRHTIELRSANGQRSLHRIQIEVRAPRGLGTP